MFNIRFIILLIKGGTKQSENCLSRESLPDNWNPQNRALFALLFKLRGRYPDLHLSLIYVDKSAPLYADKSETLYVDSICFETAA